MPGPPPKPAHLRARTNRKAGSSTIIALVGPTGADVPTIPCPPGHQWNELTLAWWQLVWTSPMASEFLESDVAGLGQVALLVDMFYTLPDPKLLGEIRLQSVRYGLSPIDRSRLQWEVKRAEESERRPVVKRPRASGDPRAALMAALK